MFRKIAQRPRKTFHRCCLRRRDAQRQAIGRCLDLNAPFGRQGGARGVSDASGAFVISTYGDKDGAPVGQYKVTVSQSVAKEISPGVLAPIPTEGIKTAVPLKYERVDTTDITVEVKADQTNSLEIELR